MSLPSLVGTIVYVHPRGTMSRIETEDGQEYFAPDAEYEAPHLMKEGTRVRFNPVEALRGPRANKITAA